MVAFHPRAGARVNLKWLAPADLERSKARLWVLAGSTGDGEKVAHGVKCVCVLAVRFEVGT